MPESGASAAARVAYVAWSYPVITQTFTLRSADGRVRSFSVTIRPGRNVYRVELADLPAG